MTSFVLKIIAIISMIIDHSSYAYYGKFTYFNLLGRIAFPIFAFQISEGYIYTKSKKKYMFRLLLFSIISQIPFSLFLSLIQGADIYSLNIFFTLALGLLCIIIYDYFFKKYNVLLKILSIFIIINIMLLAELLKCDYGAFGVIIILMFYLLKNKKFLMCTLLIIACTIKNLINILKYGQVYILITIFTILAIIPICLYNGKQGYKIKYLLYAFYPFHLILFYLIFN